MWDLLFNPLKCANKYRSKKYIHITIKSGGLNMIEEFNMVLKYVEENLTKDINMKKISRIIKLSAYNFQKYSLYS